MRVIRIKRANVHCQAAFLCDSFHTALKHKLRHKILCPVCIGHPVGCSKEIRRDVQGLITCFNNTCCLIFYLWINTVRNGCECVLNILIRHAVTEVCCRHALPAGFDDNRHRINRKFKRITVRAVICIVISGITPYDKILTGVLGIWCHWLVDKIIIFYFA